MTGSLEELVYRLGMMLTGIGLMGLVSPRIAFGMIAISGVVFLVFG